MWDDNDEAQLFIFEEEKIDERIPTEEEKENIQDLLNENVYSTQQIDSILKEKEYLNKQNYIIEIIGNICLQNQKMI